MAMDELSIIYYGYIYDASGYGQAARAYIHALHSAGVALSVVDLANHGIQVHDELVQSLVGRKANADFHLFHGIPPQWARRAFRLNNAIGMTVWETDTMPSQWRNALNHTLEVWLPCEFNVSAFSRALEKPIFKLPHPVFPPCGNGNGHLQCADSVMAAYDGDFVFYSIFEWQERKSPQGLIESFLRAFPTESDAVLIIKTNHGADDLARRSLETARRLVHSDARVEVRSEAWDEAQIDALHRRGDCYVSLHRGEGWGYPLFEAASRGTPVIATSYSGPLDYLDPQAHSLIRFQPRPVRQPYLYYHPSMQWAEPDLEHASELMRWVYYNRDTATSQAVSAAKTIQSAYSPEAVGAMARERLMELLKRTQPQKFLRHEWTRRAAALKPALPIPADWYDEDYFENGVKSNWERGYTWPLFQELFQNTADFLTDIFQEASSYLDVGTGKGFLVRALRDRGKECWGFDHSRWAVDQAEERVKPYVTCASVDDVQYDREFDLLLAFSIFESLTEQQVLSFLSRALHWTRQAMLAVIPSFEDEQEESLYKSNDRDLSHVTMKSRRWWHDLFVRAGWRHDPLHRIVERMSQRHELPTRMGWKVYVYAPR
jgi:glycosyltransferase involved in cell wall biosynthesis